MKIHESSLQRIRTAGLSGEGLANIFAKMGEGVALFGAAASRIQIDWQLEDDDLDEGDLVPSVELTLSPAPRTDGLDWKNDAET